MTKIDFLGKGDVAGHHLAVPFHELKADAKKSVGKADIDGNLIVHGDNLLALKALLPRYAGQVKCIYIDPPYNTGNEKWVYNDKVNSPLIKDWHKKVVDRDDQCRHDKWLCMMWPRLQLLRELLADDGVIFISIDDNEQHRLRTIMDEIFGEENLIANIVVKSNPGGRDYGGIARTHDYVIAYTKYQDTELEMVSIDDADRSAQSDELGEFELRELRNRNIKFNVGNRPNLYYPFYVNSKNIDEHTLYEISLIKKKGWVEVYPLESQGVKTVWRWGKEKVVKNLNRNVKAKKKRDGNFQIVEKFRRTGKRERSILAETSYRNEQGTLYLKSIFDGESVFDNPKSFFLIKRIIELGCEEDSIILDSFAGSGTTAHAVLALNKEDSGNRKFVLVECEDYANEITAERVRRVIKGVPKAKDENLKKGLDGTFTFATLGDEIDPEKILSGKTMPSWETLARHVFWLATGTTLAKNPNPNKAGLVGAHKSDHVYLLYKPDMKFMQSDKAILTGKVADELGAKRKKGDRIIYYAAGAYVSQKDMQKSGILFCQLPWAITKKIGGSE